MKANIWSGSSAPSKVIVMTTSRISQYTSRSDIVPLSHHLIKCHFYRWNSFCPIAGSDVQLHHWWCNALSYAIHLSINPASSPISVLENFASTPTSDQRDPQTNHSCPLRPTLLSCRKEKHICLMFPVMSKQISKEFLRTWSWSL